MEQSVPPHGTNRKVPPSWEEGAALALGNAQINLAFLSFLPNFVGMKVSELFERCVEMVQAEPSVDMLRYMHETLVLACAEALKGSGQGFGNLMAQTDFLCKQAGIGVADRIAIQTMRRHSNRKDDQSHPADQPAVCPLCGVVLGR